MSLAPSNAAPQPSVAGSRQTQLAQRRKTAQNYRMDPQITPPRLRIRIVFDGDEVMGPGKAELLERIDRCGSIAAAGREMEMSYKRAWMLVEEMNAAFSDPLVTSARGGAKGGGAQVTATGLAVISHYRAAEAATALATAPHLQDLQGLLRDIPERK